jgi:uncharacterized membrane protein YbhN (UPF0104 family)
MSRFGKRAVGLGVTAVSVYFVIPSVVEVFTSWPELGRLRPGSLAIMSVLILLSLVCFWILLGLCLRSRRWLLVATSQLASSAIARIVPGGAATATAVQYRMISEAGVSKSTAGTGLTVATLLNFAVLFSLPVFAIPAILLGPPIAPLLLRAALVGVIGFVAAGIVGGVVLFRDRPLVLLGVAVDRVMARFGRSDPASLRADGFLVGRDLIRSHLASNWWLVLLSSIGKWGFEYAALLMAVRGVGHDDLSSVLLLAFVTASLLARIPLTPGGLGFVEAGLTGTLTLAGLSAGDAVLATLAYRLVSYWLPIPFGVVAYGVHRRYMQTAGVVTERLSAAAEHASIQGGVAEPA